MLIANAFNAMGTKPIFKKGRALQRFTGDNFLKRGMPVSSNHPLAIVPAEPVAEANTAVFIVRTHDLLQYFFHGMPGNFIVPEVIAKFLELVEDHQILTGFAQFPAFIEDFFNIGFGSGSGNDLTRDLCQPFKAFLAHSFR